MIRLACTTLVFASLFLLGCYQRTSAPELSTNESDVAAFRQDMGMEAPVESTTEEESESEDSE